MAKKIIDLSGLGGLAPRYYGDRPFTGGSDRDGEVINWQHRIIGESNMYATGVVNPMAIYGCLSPANGSFETIDATDTTDVIGASLYDPGDKLGQDKAIWLLDRGTKLWHLSSTLDTSATEKNEIIGAEGVDLADYLIGGSRKLFYSYKSEEGGDVAIFDTDGTGFDDTWLSSTAAGGFNTAADTETRFIVADNSFMYLTDGSYLHKIDGTSAGGTNGTAIGNILSFPSTFTIVDGVNFRGTIWLSITRNSGVGSYQNRLCGVYVWDRQSTTANMSDFIPINGTSSIKALFVFRGVVWIFTVSTDGRGQLRVFDGTNFKIIKELGKNDYPNFPQSVEVVDDFIFWLARGGRIFTYGKIDSSTKDALYQIGDLFNEVPEGETWREAGAISVVGGHHSSSTGLEIYEVAYNLAFKTFDGYYLRRFYPNTHDAPVDDSSPMPHSGDFKTLLILLPKLSIIKSVTLYYPKTYTGSGATRKVMDIDLYFNGSRTSWGTKTLTRDDGARGYYYIPVDKNNVNSIQLGLTWKTDNSLEYTITPMYAEIEYEETKKMK